MEFTEVFLIGLTGVNTAVLIYLFFHRQAPGKDGPETGRRLEQIERNQDRAERLIKEETADSRDDLRKHMDSFSQGLFERLKEASASQNEQLGIFTKQLSSLTQMNENKLEKMRETVEQQLRAMQEDNSSKLEKMRETVDEKLHATLERRLGESFQVVSDRLEKVHQGLGEMQTLASGVGDLKKVLTNVKTRGTWGEVQLGNLLEQVLTPDQYEVNVITKKNSRDPVEFAIKMPGRDDKKVLLPIDAKFPVEDYERLQDAQEKGDVQLVEEAAKAIDTRIKFEARKIRDKYIDPPNTTDFGILFLPTEGLYAEVLRRPGFCDSIQREHRVVITGPSTIWALLNSLQMGFRTVAVEKSASKVWTLLGQVKTEFGKFGDILDKTQKKLQEASKTIESAASKSRNIERKLGKVQELPETPVEAMIEHQAVDAVTE